MERSTNMINQDKIQKVTGVWICLGREIFGEGNTPDEAFRAYEARCSSYVTKSDCRFFFAESFLDSKDA